MRLTTRSLLLPLLLSLLPSGALAQSSAPERSVTLSLDGVKYFRVPLPAQCDLAPFAGSFVRGRRGDLVPGRIGIALWMRGGVTWQDADFTTDIDAEEIVDDFHEGTRLSRTQGRGPLLQLVQGDGRDDEFGDEQGRIQARIAILGVDRDSTRAVGMILFYGSEEALEAHWARIEKQLLGRVELLSKEVPQLGEGLSRG